MLDQAKRMTMMDDRLLRLGAPEGPTPQPIESEPAYEPIPSLAIPSYDTPSQRRPATPAERRRSR